MGNYLTYNPPTTNDLEPYITDGALSNVLDDIAAGAAQIAAVDQAIDASESEVDSYLGVRYTVPLTSPPEVVIDAAAVLTVERIYNRGLGPTDRVRERAEQIRAWLRDVSNGKANIVGVADAPTTGVDSGVIDVDAEDRELTRTTLDIY
jgi:phage gp36-like protein